MVQVVVSKMNDFTILHFCENAELYFIHVIRVNWDPPGQNVLADQGLKGKNPWRVQATGRQICVDTVLDCLLGLMSGLSFHILQYVAKENSH